MTNQETLRNNAATFKEANQAVQGAAREGSALLQGLVRCGCCGHRMAIRYRQKPAYHCSQLATQYGRQTCLSITAPKIDALVTQAFFDAIQPAQLDILEEFLAQQNQEYESLSQQWQQRIQRATYDTQRAERQYNQADPDNRLVTASLEKRWEEKLLALHEVERDCALFQQQQHTATIPSQLRQQIQNLSQTLPDLWPQLAYTEQKELLRTLISQVILSPKDKSTIDVKIVWLSGHYTCFNTNRAAQKWSDISFYPQLLERIQQLWGQGTSDDEIATILNHENFTAIDGSPLSRIIIRDLRLKQGWSVRPAAAKIPPKVDGKFTTRGLAIACHADTKWVQRQIYDGTIPPELLTRHPHQRCYLIDASNQLIEQLKSKAANRRRYKKRTTSNA